MATLGKVQLDLATVIETFSDGSRLVSVLIDGRQYDLSIESGDNGLNPAYTSTFKGIDSE